MGTHPVSNCSPGQTGAYVERDAQDKKKWNSLSSSSFWAKAALGFSSPEIQKTGLFSCLNSRRNVQVVFLIILLLLLKQMLKCFAGWSLEAKSNTSWCPWQGAGNLTRIRTEPRSSTTPRPSSWCFSPGSREMCASFVHCSYLCRSCRGILRRKPGCCGYLQACGLLVTVCPMDRAGLSLQPGGGCTGPHLHRAGPGCFVLGSSTVGQAGQQDLSVQNPPAVCHLPTQQPPWSIAVSAVRQIWKK